MLIGEFNLAPRRLRRLARIATSRRRFLRQDSFALWACSLLKVLAGDKRAIFVAAGHAQRAVSYLHHLQPGTESEGEGEAA